MMVLPFMSLYLLEDLDWTKSMAAVATACFGLGNLAGAIVGGWLSERFPPIKLMFGSLLLGGLCFILMAYIQSFYLLCGWIFITVLVSDILRPAAMVAISEFSTKDNLARGISLLRIAINLGIAIGPFVAGIMIEKVGYQFIFFGDGVTCIFAGFALYLLFKETWSFKPTKIPLEENPNSMMSAYKDGYYLLFLFFNMLMLIIFFQILYSVPVFFSEVYKMSENQIGIFFAMNGLLIFALEIPIIYALEKKKLDYDPLLWGMVLIGISFVFLLLPMPHFWISVILFNLFISIGEILNFPFISTLSIIRGEKRNKGSYIGSMASMFSIAIMLAPLVFLPFVDVIGYKVTWIISIAVCLLMALFLKILRPSFESSNTL